MTADHITNIAAHVGIDVARAWNGVDAVWPLLEKMRLEGAVVLIKLDGQRTSPEDNGPYTVLASGGRFGCEFIRTDSASIREALCDVISHDAAAVWGIPPPEPRCGRGSNDCRGEHLERGKEAQSRALRRAPRAAITWFAQARVRRGFDRLPCMRAC